MEVPSGRLLWAEARPGVAWCCAVWQVRVDPAISESLSESLSEPLPKYLSESCPESDP